MPVRFATTGDSAEILRIYAQYIDTPVTFECELPGRGEFEKRIAGICREYPYIVYEENGRILGYAYAHRHKEREAYQWNAELSVYIDNENTSKGLGKKLYWILIEMLKAQGIKTVYGAVTSPNRKSEGLHTSLGFTLMGVCRNTGYKAGKWRDVVWYEKQIAPYDLCPEPFIPINRVPGEQLLKIMAEDDCLDLIKQ